MNREVGEGVRTRLSKAAGRRTWPDLEEIVKFVDGRTLDNVETSLKVGGGQQGWPVVKKAHAATVGQNQPSESTSSAVDAHYTQGYDKGYALGAQNFGNGSKFSRNPKPKVGSEGQPGTNFGRGGGPGASGGGKKCVWCKGNTHEITHCDVFKKLSLEAKKAFVSKDKPCFNCLKFGHASCACESTFKCFVCKGSHHTLLHGDQQPAIPV